MTRKLILTTGLLLLAPAVLVAGGLTMPFSVRGSIFALSSHQKNDFGSSHEAGVWLRTVVGAGTNGFIARLVPTADGKPVEVTGLEESPEVFRIVTAAGTVEVTLSGGETALFRSTSPGLGLTFDFWNSTLWRFAWEVPAGKDRTAVVLPLYASGERLALEVLRGEKRVDCDWDGWNSKSCAVRVAPAAQGFEATIRASRFEWDGQSVTIGFDEAVAAARNSFDRFLKGVPSVPEEFAETRARAARLMWSAIVEPRGHAKRPLMLMSKNWMDRVWSWDHVFNAMALAAGDADAAWDQFICMFDWQSPGGQLPDSVSPHTESWTFVKPPVHGWALRRMMNAGLELAPARLDEAYDRLSKWTAWWLTCRDADRNGLCEYHHGNDSGWDNSTAFLLTPPVETPELQAYLVLQMETLAELAVKRGRAAEAAEWRRKADALAAKTLATLFDADGSPLVRSIRDGKTSKPTTMLTRLAMVLGKRLPENVRRKLVADVKSGMFLTEHGLATESPSSSHYQADGYWRGPIWAPETMIAVDGLVACGEREFARDLALRFCRLCRKGGFAENFDALTGEPLRDRAYTWTASVFLLLAHDL